MRWTQTLIPTLRNDPSDAESASHKLMQRAGLIRKVSAGVYAYLPLGWRVVRKVMEIVRQEMERAGAVELYLPVLHPPELWKETGRFDAFGDVLFKLKDRHGRWNVLGPTHEEIITDLVRRELTSYRQIPITLYQIQVKLRDEPRPRGGVLRTREFIMKDAYSFDADADGMGKNYQKQYDAYHRIFQRAGLNFVAVEADTGLMGGDVSHEFMVPCPTGEDTMTRCPKCGYAANREKVECPVPAGSTLARATQELHPVREVSTPGRSTVEQVCEFLKVKAETLVKTLILRADGKFVAALVPGNGELNFAKLARAAKAVSLELASAEEIESVTGGPLGFSGPIGLKIPIFADRSLELRHNLVAGANKRDTHVLNVNVFRDYRPEVITDLRLAQEGDPCPKCASAIRFEACIEVGHVFKLGTKYSEAMGAKFLDAEGRQKTLVMGCYGIGVNRIAASAIEGHHDEHGILWPKEIAPYAVHVVTVNQKDLRVVQHAEDVERRLAEAGIEALWDDREETAGVKFADADLLGCPVRVTVGSKTVKQETVDVRPRTGQGEKSVKVADVAGAVREALAAYPF